MYVRLRNLRTLLDKLTVMITAYQQRSILTFSQRRLQILFVNHREVTEMVHVHQEKITCLPVLLAATVSYIGLHSNGRQVIFS